MSAPQAEERPSAADLELVQRIANADHWAVVATSRPNGTIQSTIVTAGVHEHPLIGPPMVAFVSRGGTVKLANMRRKPHATVTFRSAREWVTIEGRAWLIGPDDPADGFEPGRLPQLLRDIFAAAGGTHDNWAEYDRVMAAERRTAVYVQLDRVYTNPGRR